MPSSSTQETLDANAPGRRLVVDANILVRAVLGVRVRELIIDHAGHVAFYAPGEAFLEAETSLPPLYEKRRLSLKATMAVYERIGMIVQELPLPFYIDRKREALARIGSRDPQDWPVLACALTLDCPIWTEDQDFFGTGVATWTTSRIEHFFSSSLR